MKFIVKGLSAGVVSLIAAALICTTAPEASAAGGAYYHAGGPFGLGIVLGRPTGFSAKYWLERDSAVDFALGAWGGGIGLYSDYLYHIDAIKPRDKSIHFPFYIGAGGFALINQGRPRYKNDYVGARMPLGIAFMKEDLPLDVFFELAPAIVLFDTDDDIGIHPDMMWGLGARFYF